MNLTGGTGKGQIEVLQQKLPQPTGDNPSQPRMPFQSDLDLTREQEDALLSHAMARIEQIERQLGKKPWSRIGGDFQVVSDPHTWMGKRELFTARYYNHVKDRQINDTVYFYSNLTASLSQRISAQMIAKSVKFFLGEPDEHDWFVVEPVGVEDQILADKIKKYARWKAQQCKIKPQMIKAIEYAYVRGESVQKIIHDEIFQVFEKTEMILVESSGGNPIFNAYGDYITSDDLWIDQLQAIPASELPPEAQALAQPAPDNDQDADDPMMHAPTGAQVLKKDGVTPMPENPIYEMRKVARKRVTFSGPSAEVCYYRDFLAPLDAPGIQPGEADFICHLYDRTTMQIVAMFSQQFQGGDNGIEQMQKAVNALQGMFAVGSEAKSDAQAPRADFSENDTSGSPNSPRVQLAECWLTYDANNDGQEEEILLIIDRLNKVPIYYEYTSNVTLTGKRPFEVTRAIDVDGRWWGMGSMEYFQPEQEFIDLQINRKNFRESSAGRVTLWRPYNTLEGERDPNLQLNHGRTYTPKEGKKKEDIVEYVELPDVGSNLMDLVNLFMQFMQVKSGVLTGADRSVAALPSSNTLGEEQLITQSGNELFDMFLVRLHNGIFATIEQVLDVMFSQVDKAEVFSYFDGAAVEIIELTPDDVRDLTLKTELSITRNKDKLVLSAGAQASALLEKFYSLPLPLQIRFQTFYQDQLKSLRVSGADKLIVPIAPAAMQQEPVANVQTDNAPGASAINQHG